MIRRILGRTDPAGVIGYRSYGTATRVLVLGRALEDEGVLQPDASHSWMRNFREAVKRFEADPLPHARVEARIGDATATLEADDEGFLHHWLDLDSPIPTTGWQDVALALAPDAHPGAITGTGHVLVPSVHARFGVISDIDDTVLQSRVASPFHAARLMLFENARTRLPFAGVAAFYRALVAGAGGDEGNPIFYISSSPWNVFQVLVDFLDAQGIPLGPLLLRDWDLDRSLTRNAGHKATLIREVLDTYPSMRFILVGDTSQEDPEIYAQVVRDTPDRVLAIYIRDVGATPLRRGAVEQLVREVHGSGVPLVLAETTLAIAEHAAAQGWIDAAHLPAVREEKREDEGTSPGKVPS